MNRKIYATLLVFIMLLSLSTAVYATGTETDGAPALRIQTRRDEGETVVSIYLESCEGVTNGRFVVNYDADVIVHTSATVSGAYEISSINAQTPGTVALAWVGSKLTGESILMLTLRFQAISDDFVGTTYTVESDGIYADSEELSVAGATITTRPDTSALEQAIKKAEALERSKYTELSFAAVEAALTEAKAVLADPEATQAQIDDATITLNDALDALELIDENPNTFDSKVIVLTAILTAISAVSVTSLLYRDKRRNNV